MGSEVRSRNPRTHSAKIALLGNYIASSFAWRAIAKAVRWWSPRPGIGISRRPPIPNIKRAIDAWLVLPSPTLAHGGRWRVVAANRPNSVPSGVAALVVLLRFHDIVADIEQIVTVWRPYRRAGMMRCAKELGLQGGPTDRIGGG